METLYNFWNDDVAVIDYSLETEGVYIVRVEGIEKRFTREETAVRFLYKLGYIY